MIVLTIFFLCWGSFLNVLGYRLITGEPLVLSRSACPHCKQILAPYDLIPLVSYTLLLGKCRSCARPISPLYPFIELTTALSCLILFYITPGQYFPLLFLFFSALIVTIRSDLETMLISRYATTYLVPIAVVGTYLNLLPISTLESITGFVLGWTFMKTIQYGFKKIMHKDGLGDGDIDLIAMIGAFTGPIGCWMSLLVGSVLGICAAIILYVSNSMSTDKRIPFGPFLAFGALIWVILFMTLDQFLIF